MMLLPSALAGFALGLVYVMLLWLHVRWALGRPRPAGTLAAGSVARLALFALIFMAVARGGIAPAASLLAGFWAGRWYALARLGGIGHGR